MNPRQPRPIRQTRQHDRLRLRRSVPQPVPRPPSADQPPRRPRPVLRLRRWRHKQGGGLLHPVRRGGPACRISGQGPAQRSRPRASGADGPPCRGREGSRDAPWQVSRARRHPLHARRCRSHRGARPIGPRAARRCARLSTWGSASPPHRPTPYTSTCCSPTLGHPSTPEQAPGAEGKVPRPRRKIEAS